MSGRCKRPGGTQKGGDNDTSGGPPSKRRKCRPSTNAQQSGAAAQSSTSAAATTTTAPDDDDAQNQNQSGAHWQPRPINDLKISSIYNRSATEAPAELFRKDLISAMKLPDSEPLALDEYWVICDQWKQEWERGVQVPVNPDSLPEPLVTVTHSCIAQPNPIQNLKNQDFKLPKNKYIRITKDDNFNPEEHILSNTPAKAEAACSYDLDDTDMAWLQILNGERAQLGLGSITEDQLERVIEKLELQCWDKIQQIMKNEEGLGIEYDENVICDVCRSPDSEEGNEMVFCDSCNICVHQACYGIMTIPEGQWLCRTCSLGQRPDCVLCPNKGGAMKSTRSGHKWAHVSCALWIPEVSIGCVEKMEPITKISSIPQNRWGLICVLCRERVGACIQCSVKTCKTAYHVTCAFKHGLEMRAIIEDENADDGVKLRSYCQKHSVQSKKEKSVCSGSEDDDSKRKKRKDMTSEEKNQARAARLQEIEAEFDQHVTVKDIMSLEVDSEGLTYIYNYWKLKRRAGHNKPLLPPKSEDVDMLSHKKEQADLEKMKMFVQLRQDLERVRNLCYMVSRREKLSREFFRLREQTFDKQAAVLASCNNITPNVTEAVIEANHGPSIYDKLYSSTQDNLNLDFSTILARIAGYKSDSDEKKDLNGMIKDRKMPNPYKKLYFNGSSKRRSTSFYGSSLSSASSSEEQKPNISSTENDKQTSLVLKKRGRKPSESAKAAERRKNRINSIAKIKSESSSEDEKPPKKDWSTISKSRTLRRMEQELRDKNLSGTDSDDLMPVRLSKPVENIKPTTIYSDTDSSDSNKEDKSSNATSDSQKLKTKASVKEFVPVNKKEKEVKKDAKKKDFDPSDLIVPQRQAAKKATENLKSTTSRTKEPAAPVEPEVKVKEEKIVVEEKEKEKEKEVQKPKVKPKKEVVKKVVEVFEPEKEVDSQDNELLAYVPQRQAAKKAQEHIKSGLGKNTAPVETQEDKSKEVGNNNNNNIKKKEEVVKVVKKEEEVVKKRKSSTSSSSSSSSSSSTSSSSSSDSEEEVPPKKTQENVPSVTETSKRTSAKDWPFLDKGTKSERAKSRSSSTESDRKKSQKAKSVAPNKTNKVVEKRRVADKKLKTSDKQPEPKADNIEAKSAIPEGKEPPRRSRGRAKKQTNACDRTRNADVRSGNIPNRERSNLDKPKPNKETKTESRKRKSDEVLRDVSTSSEKSRTENTPKPNEKESVKSSKLSSPIRKTDTKKLTPTTSPNIEKEILERKAKTPKSKTSFFEKWEKPTQFDQKFDNILNKSPTKEKFNSTDLDHLSERAQKEKSSPRYKKPEPIPARIKKQIEHIKEVKKDASPQRLSVEEKKDSPSKEKDRPIPKSPTEKFMNRSIFSPQPTKETMEIFDFDNNMLNEVQEPEGDDEFGLSKEDENARAPLSFTFAGSDLLFKEDSKEDSARETLNLVEKLRMELSKKSGNGVEVGEEEPPKPELEKTDSPEVETPEKEVHQELEVRVEIKETSDYNQGSYQYSSEIQVDVGKTSTPQVSQVADERWVPPSETAMEENKKFEPEPEPEPLPEDSVPEIVEKSSLLLEDKMSERTILPSQTPFIEPASMDCMPSPSPYADMHQQAKWADSVVMPARRDSSSSENSEESSIERNEDMDISGKQREEILMGNHPGMIPEMPYGIMSQGLQPFAPNSIADALPYHPFSEASQFVGPVSLFAAPNLNTQIPFPSPGASIYPPSYGAPAPFPPGHSVIPPIQKPENENFPNFPTNTCTAAFTSSSHNMALTAAMVVSEPPKEQSIIENQENFVPNEEVTPNIENQPPVTNSPNTDGSIKSASSTPAGKKSPAKPTRTSARFISQQKSPSKSPGKSPRNLVESKSSSKNNKDNNKRHSKPPNRASYAQNRGRGRGRNRNRNIPHVDIDPYISNTIHNKLVGTVYDLDFEEDELTSDITDWRALRERRRSTDIHDRKSDYLSRDSSQSPKFTSPSQKTKYNTDLRDLRPPTPINIQINKSIPSPIAIAPSERFPDIGQPVLPGPVDMRTYNSNFEPNQNTDAASYSNQILGEFARVGPQLCDIDEEYEKNLELSLRSEKKTEEIETPNLKVSLSDSRNQLKVKIKGPFLDSNYASNVQPVSGTLDYEISSNITSLSTVSNVNTPSVAPATGTSNLRRMRKKELLRQYWTQDMNMDEPANAQIAGQASVPTTTPVSRTTITIPKAVASMTSIPTREDYKAVVDANMEKKRKKEKGSSRLELEDDMPERRRSVGSTGSNASGGFESNKKKGRPVRGTVPNAQPTTPKLKIKIGGTILGETYSTIDDKKFKGRPPKKRITTIAKPSIEDLKRESMKYRRMVMADFDFEKKKRSKVDKERKKKRKKEKLQVITESDSTKLIIRIGKKKGDDKTNSEYPDLSTLSCGETTVKTRKLTPPENNTTNKTTTDLRKVRSIKLKFARCHEGSYIMKNESEQSSGEPPPLEITQPPPGDGPNPNDESPTISDKKDKVIEVIPIPETKPNESPPKENTNTLIPPLPIINKDCEVR